MKKVLAVLIVLAICVVGFGFYRGWFAVSSPDSSEGSNKVNANLATDPDKIEEDVETVMDKAAELTGSTADDSAETTDRPTNEVPPNQAPTDDGRLPTGTRDGAPPNND